MRLSNSATEVAAMLDRVQTLDPALTGPLSMLDEATLKWLVVYPQLHSAQSRFAQARQNMWPDIRTDEAIAEMRAAAAALAAEMRALGDVQLTLCTEQNLWGKCNSAIKDGVCYMAEYHTPK